MLCCLTKAGFTPSSWYHSGAPLKSHFACDHLSLRVAAQTRQHIVVTGRSICVVPLRAPTPFLTFACVGVLAWDSILFLCSALAQLNWRTRGFQSWPGRTEPLDSIGESGDAPHRALGELGHSRPPGLERRLPALGPSKCKAQAQRCWGFGLELFCK